jgi:maltooligosyltrehalose trehalohydrolase
MLTLAGPFTPMLFMGEEWAASSPFQFFTSHPEPELGAATAEGRVKEFEKMGWDPAVVPDPQDPETFRRSKLDWDEVSSGRHAVLLETYRRLAGLRRTIPALTDPGFSSTSCAVDGEVFTMQRGDVLMEVNDGDTDASLDLSRWSSLSRAAVIFETPSGVSLADGALSLPPHAGALLH